MIAAGQKTAAGGSMLARAAHWPERKLHRPAARKISEKLQLTIDRFELQRLFADRPRLAYAEEERCHKHAAAHWLCCRSEEKPVIRGGRRRRRPGAHRASRCAKRFLTAPGSASSQIAALQIEDDTCRRPRRMTTRYRSPAARRATGAAKPLRHGKHRRYGRLKIMRFLVLHRTANQPDGWYHIPRFKRDPAGRPNKRIKERVTGDLRVQPRRAGA